ncbi:MAG: hypothetical protein HOC79_08690 [Euryarchaeota archaeon]|nr:hypothetical protein [Euryarchaeota archaeon]
MDEKVVLIVVSQPDIASLNQGKALLNFGGWVSAPPVEGDETWRQKNVRIWWFSKGLLHEDNLEKRWQNSTGEVVSEVIFPSRHSAASGQPSLTLHPIGVTHLGEDDDMPFGGIRGRAPPPSTRIAAWFRKLLQQSETIIGERFELSLEVTHHGPWVDVPCMFIEIGSTEEMWPDLPAADCLAQLMWDGLGLGANSAKSATLVSSEVGVWDENINSGEKVVIGLGGGHYALRFASIAAYPNVWLGHMLANYALPMEKPTDENWDPKTGVLPEGTWASSIDEAVASTKLAFPKGELWAYLDKKSFKGWQRQVIMRHLDSIGIPFGRTKDIVSK